MRLQDILKNMKVATWLENYLVSRLQHTVVDQVRPLSQGCVLGPVPFLFLQMTLYRMCLCVHVSMSADDCIIFYEISCRMGQQILNDALNSVNNWCVVWQMNLSISKCPVMTLTTRDLQVNMHIDRIWWKASMKLQSLGRKSRHGAEEIKLNIYRACIRPLSECGGAVWNPYSLAQT